MQSTTSIGLGAFNGIHMVVADVTSVVQNEAATVPAYLLELNLGEKLMAEHMSANKKKTYLSSAQLCTHHSTDQLARQQLLCVINFPRKQIGKMKSDCLTTGVQDPVLYGDAKRESTVAMLPSSPVAMGSRVTVDGAFQVVDSNARKLSWGEFAVADLRVGTVIAAQLQETTSKVYRVVMTVDFGPLGTMQTLAPWQQASEAIIGRQALCLVNLDQEDLIKHCGTDSPAALLCTPAEGVWMTPFKAVANGYKLA